MLRVDTSYVELALVQLGRNPCPVRRPIIGPGAERSRLPKRGMALRYVELGMID